MEFIKNVVIDFIKDEEGIGVVEIILILVIVIGLVVIFKSQIEKIVTNAFKTITQDSDNIIGK